MRVFVTGAGGFVGSALVPRLIHAGHHVVGLCRSDASAEALVRAGGEVFRGDVNDPGRLRAAAESAEAIIHTAFHHDFANMKRSSENDRKVIETLGEVLKGSDRPLIVTSGTGLVRSQGGGIALESDPHFTSAEFPRAATEEAADALIQSGMHVIVVRLPQVHNTHRQGRLSLHVDLAREKGWVAYIGDGANRVPAVHVADASQLFRLALERGEAGARFHAVAEEGVPMREIAEAIGRSLRLPLKSIAPDEATGYFGAIAQLAALDLAASGELTRQTLTWVPADPGLLADLRDMGGLGMP